jgi:hypothetical protein
MCHDDGVAAHLKMCRGAYSLEWTVRREASQHVTSFMASCLFFWSSPTLVLC